MRIIWIAALAVLSVCLFFPGQSRPGDEVGVTILFTSDVAGRVKAFG